MKLFENFLSTCCIFLWNKSISNGGFNTSHVLIVKVTPTTKLPSRLSTRH